MLKGSRRTQQRFEKKRHKDERRCHFLEFRIYKQNGRGFMGSGGGRGRGTGGIGGQEGSGGTFNLFICKHV